MSSFGDGNSRTYIEQELRHLFYEYYNEDDKEIAHFILDVLDVLNYMFEWRFYN